jgi:ribonuclease Z
VLLFDCGEGTQYQLLRAGINRNRIDGVFITHLHGDHFFGLPGLISTMALLGRRAPLAIVAPAGVGGILDALPGLTEADLTYELRIVELPDAFGAATVYEAPGFTVEARPLEHRVFAAGFRFEGRRRPGKVDAERARASGLRETWQFDAVRRGEAVTLGDGTRIDPADIVGPSRRGESFAYVLDTRPCTGGRELARGVDLVLHDATFTDALLQRAIETGHSTAREAAEVARDAGARRLLLTHFSTRYADPAPLLEEARAVFPNTDAASELVRYVLEPEEAVERVGE